MHHAAELNAALNALSPAMAAAMGYHKADNTPGDLAMSTFDRTFSPVTLQADADAAMNAYLWLENLWHRADAIATVLGREGMGSAAWGLRSMIAEVRSSAWDFKSAVEGGNSARIADAHSVLMNGVFADGSEV